MTVALHMNETEDTGSLLFLYAPFPAHTKKRHTKKRHIQRSGTYKEAAAANNAAATRQFLFFGGQDSRASLESVEITSL